jgi:serine/threonine-protein kinase
VTLNLVDTTTLRQLNARTIDLELQDVAAMQDGVVREAAMLTGAALGPDARQALTLGGTSTPAAYEAYVQARGHLQRYEALENVEAAIAAFQRALAHDARFALARAGLGEAYWRKYELVKDAQWVALARASCTEARDLAEGMPAAYLTLGLIDAGTGRYEDAISELKRGIALDPLSSDAYRALANTYRASGRSSDAETMYKTAVQVRPGYWANYEALGSFYFRLARYDDAAAEYRRVVDLTPDNARGYNDLGAVYYATRRYAEAARMFERSVAVKPNGGAYSNLGTLYFTQGRYAEAARMLERAITFNQRDSLLRSNLASSYYWAPGEREKARSVYEQALALVEDELRVNPRNATLLLRMADCQSRLGNTARARDSIERSLALAPGDVNLMFRAGEVYEQLGDRGQAVEWINKALGNGYPPDLVKRSPGLANLRLDPRFKAQH